MKYLYDYLVHLYYIVFSVETFNLNNEYLEQELIQ